MNHRQRTGSHLVRDAQMGPIAQSPKIAETPRFAVASAWDRSRIVTSCPAHRPCADEAVRRSRSSVTSRYRCGGRAQHQGRSRARSGGSSPTAWVCPTAAQGSSALMGYPGRRRVVSLPGAAGEIVLYRADASGRSRHCGGCLHWARRIVAGCGASALPTVSCDLRRRGVIRRPIGAAGCVCLLTAWIWSPWTRLVPAANWSNSAQRHAQIEPDKGRKMS